MQKNIKDAADDLIKIYDVYKIYKEMPSDLVITIEKYLKSMITSKEFRLLVSSKEKFEENQFNSTNNKEEIDVCLIDSPEEVEGLGVNLNECVD